MNLRVALDQTRRHPSAVLLAVQLIGVLIYPYMDTSTPGRLAFETFGLLVLLLAVLSIRELPGPTWIVVSLASAAAGLAIVDIFWHNVVVQVLSAALHAIFYFWATASLLGYMLRDRKVTTDELFAVGATFTLVAWGFGYLFLLLQILQPGCFIAAVNSADPRTWTELLFLSFTTLSSTGLSDIIPITAQARSVVMLEQLAGLGYVALVVSRLVALTTLRARGDQA